MKRNSLTLFHLFQYTYSPILSIAKYGYEEYIDGSQVAVCLTSVDSFWPSFFFIGSISLFFVLPMIILVVLYTVIAKHLMNNPGITTHGNRSNVLKYRKQVIFMLGAVVLSFFVCLLPFRALTLWIIVVPSETIMSLGIDGYYSLLYFCRIMLYLNSAMNPILYNLMSSKFRDGFLRLLQCHAWRRHRRRTGLGKFDSGGTRKGTFHTTSTNVSSSHHSSSTADRQRRKTIVAAVTASAAVAVTTTATSDDEVNHWQQVNGGGGCGLMEEESGGEEYCNVAEERNGGKDHLNDDGTIKKRFLDLKSKSMSAIDLHVDHYTILSLLKANSLDISCDNNKDEERLTLPCSNGQGENLPHVWRTISPDAKWLNAIEHAETNSTGGDGGGGEEQILVFKRESLV